MKLLLLSLISSYLSSFVIMTNAESGEPRIDDIPNGNVNENQGSRSCPNVAGSQCGGTPTGESQVPYTGETCCPDGYVCVGSEYWKGCQLETAPTKPDYCPSDNYCIGKLDDNYEIAPNKNWYIACSGGVTYCMPCASVHAGEPELVYKKYSYGVRLDMCIWPAGSPGEEYNPSTNGNGNGNGAADDLPSAAGPLPPVEETNNCPDGFCAGKSIGNYANPDDPHFFIQCADAGQFCTECPETLLYDASTNSCEALLSGTGLAPGPLPALITRSDESKKGIRRRRR